MNKNTLGEFQKWYYHHVDPDKSTHIDDQAKDHNSEIYHLLWMSNPDLSNPPPSIPILPDDHIPQEFEPSPVLEELRHLIAAKESPDRSKDPARRQGFEGIATALKNVTVFNRFIAVLGLLTASLAILVWSIGLMINHESSPSSVTINSFRIAHYDSKGQYLGEFGNLFKSSVKNHFVRISASLSAPAYCYLIALNSDGSIQLCPKANKHTPPRKADRIDDLDYLLTDGEGLQAFVLVVSRNPLPPFDDWAAQSGIAWEQIPDTGGAWSVTRHGITFMGEAQLGNETVPLPPVPLEKLYEVLGKRNDIDNFSIDVIPIHNNDTQSSPPRPEVEGRGKSKKAIPRLEVK